MPLQLLFLLMCFLAGAGGALGSMIGHGLGAGGTIAGGVIGGALGVVAAAFLAARWRWILAAQRLWTTVGGLVGFLMAVFVTLSTLSSPLGPVLSTSLAGIG